MHTECKMVLNFEDRKNFEGASTTSLRMQTLLCLIEITKNDLILNSTPENRL